MDTLKNETQDVVELVNDLWEKEKGVLINSIEKARNVDPEILEIMKELLKGSKIRSNMKNYMESTLDEEE